MTAPTRSCAAAGALLPRMVYSDVGLWRSLVIPPAPLPDLPATEQEVTAVAAQVGLRVPAACMPGVIGNLALLARHAAILRERYNNPA